ncbi:amino acid adenylation domain-containing protein [Chryseobacterium gallinarum]|uniref:amino acid adenylation domain-containing protein n=1 Tax=Chryseobacterium gallinarum TaxID=1324352 RepID=UPI0020243D10|nr:amino acid adenylation domain-containing protein [Chryseobacterium gallinarum]MCL8537189.1 amino acid adenylation domain-containing protein [Chryseobacterium gallinarum]
MKLTLPQQDIYFEQLLFPDEPIYNIGAKISIEGFFYKDIFEQAYVALIQQHDAYRCFLKGDLEHAEMLLTNEVRPLEYIDFSNKERRKNSVLEFMQKEFKKPFDIEKDKFLYRFVLIKVHEKFHYLFSVYHHMITDGWGTSLMFARLVKNYNEILKNGIIISEYPYSYENFISEDENYFNSEDFNNDKQYWTEKFKIVPENLFQKLDSSKTTNTSSRKEFVIKRAEYNELTKLALELKSSTFHIILALLYVYLGKKSQNELISIALPVLNRSGAKFKKTVGLFMGVNPLLISIDEENTFVELVEKIKNQLKQDYRHQRFPLGQLIKELGVFNQKERIFNITLSYERQDYSSHFKDTNTKVIPLSHESERVALALYIREFDETEDVKIDFDYNLNYFTQESINKITEHFQTLMESVLKNPDQKIKHLNYLTPAELYQLLYEFNDTNVEYPGDKTIIQLFEEQAKKTPDHVAVCDSEIKLSYRELKAKSDNSAKYLISKLGENNGTVGVLVERSAELLVLLLGIFKSGKSYIPIDPMLPKERIEYIIHHSQASIIITEEPYLQEFNSINTENTANFIGKDKLLQFENTQEVDTDNIPKPEDTAYIIYTSGSTGNPKGVEVGHQALTNFLTSIQSKPKVQPQDILYSVTTCSFDISILEFFTPLISGATVFIAGKETLNNIEQLKAELETINPTIIQATPSFYQMLFNAGWKGNKNMKILCGGDSLNESLAEKLLNHSKEVWNMYGPTETTIWSSTKKIEIPSDASNIGKPINNTQIYIVDKHHNLLPQYTVGRIFIAGDGLAKGYYKNEMLTEEKFINNPFSTSEKNNFKMYETGDLGKWNEEGEIEFLGRTDFQVKVRGFRIELGEIESHLEEYAGILETVADAKIVKGEKVLVAYYTTEGRDPLEKAELREYLQKKLPAYMVPGFFVELETIPLTPNGKIDRKALPDVTIEDLIRREYIAPGNEMEEKLVEIWQEVLGLDRVGVTDNFFELGGHSLAAGKIVNSISKELNKEVSLKNIFQNQTIKSLVKTFKENSKRKAIIPKAEEKDFYSLTPDQMNIWLAGQKKEFSNAYNMYSVFKIKGDFDNLLLEKSINRIIQENEILRTNFIEKEGEVFQLIKKELHFKIDSIDTKEAGFIENYVSQSLNLETDVLLKTAIIHCHEKKYLVFLTHHIIVDGMSLEMILNRLIKLYTDLESEKSISNIQFKDYSEWLLTQNKESQENIHKFQKNIHVKTKVLGDIQANGIIKNASFQLSQEEYDKLKKISSLNRITTFSVALTLLSIALNKIYQQSSICFGTVFSGRNNGELEDAIGMFVKTMPLNLHINENANFGSLAKINQELLIELEEKMNLPFTGNLNELTDFLVIYQHSDMLSKEDVDFGAFKLTKQKVFSTQSRFPMVFNFFESNGLKCEIEYRENIDYKITELIWDKILVLINCVFENPNQTIKEMEILTAQEQQLKSSVNIDFDF